MMALKGSKNRFDTKIVAFEITLVKKYVAFSYNTPFLLHNLLQTISAVCISTSNDSIYRDKERNNVSL